nr:MAG TPA: Exonuclease [Caudoviricetes sp.]
MYKKIFNGKNATHDEWLEARKQGIGGSDMAAILGFNKYRDAVSVWLDKRGELPPVEENEPMYWGNVLEEVVAQEFAKRTGWKVRNNNYTLQSTEYPYLLANIDREIVGVDAGLECKTANAFKKDEWEGDEVPTSYYIQCQHYMAVTGKSSWWIACLLGGNTFIYKEIPRNEEVIEAIIREGKVFWAMVENGTAPAVTGSESSAEALKMMYGKSNENTIELDDVAVNYINQYNNAKAKIKEATEAKDEAENILKSLLGENEVGIVGEFKVTWKMRKGAKRFNTKQFQADHPALHKQYLVKGEDTRSTFSIK